jgi:hypothetical protein
MLELDEVVGTLKSPQLLLGLRTRRLGFVGAYLWGRG